MLDSNPALSCTTISVTLTASGGAIYKFSQGATQAGNGPTATVATGGIYSVTAISANGCTAVVSTTVSGDTSMPTATLTNNGPLPCSVISVTLIAGGGTIYKFSQGGTQLNSDNKATVSAAGVYSVTALSANGCTAVASTTVSGDVSVPTASLANSGPISCTATR